MPCGLRQCTRNGQLDMPPLWHAEPPPFCGWAVVVAEAVRICVGLGAGRTPSAPFSQYVRVGCCVCCWGCSARPACTPPWLRHGAAPSWVPQPTAPGKGSACTPTSVGPVHAARTGAELEKCCVGGWVWTKSCAVACVVALQAVALEGRGCLVVCRSRAFRVLRVPALPLGRAGRC